MARLDIRGASGGGGGGGSIKDVRWVRLISDGDPSVQDDEFRAGVLDPKWVRVDANASHVTWAEGGDSLCVITGVVADAASELHAQVQAHALAVGDSIQCHWRSGGPNGEYHMSGIIVADGITPGAGNQINLMGVETNNIQVGIACAEWTGYNTRTSIIDVTGTTFMWDYHLKILRDAANVWRFYWSLEGVQWYSLGSVTNALVPSHIGLCCTSWGSSVKHQNAFDYFRRQTG